MPIADCRKLPGPRIVRWAVAAALFLLLVAFIRRLDSPEARYQYYPEYYEAIFGLAGTVDMVALGPSGMLTLFNANQFAELLTQRVGRNVIVLDLSKSWPGVCTDYIIARDLLSQVPVRHILVQYRSHIALEHPRFHELATFSDIVDSSFSMETLTFSEHLHRTLELWIRKIVDHSVLILSGRYRSLEVRARRPAVTQDLTPTPNPVRPDLIRDWADRHAATWEDKPGHRWSLTAALDSRNRFCYRKLVELARASGSKVTFVDAPMLFRPEIDGAFAREVTDTFGADYVYLTHEELRPLYPRGFADLGHMNAYGQAYQTGKLAQKITP